MNLVFLTPEMTARITALATEDTVLRQEYRALSYDYTPEGQLKKTAIEERIAIIKEEHSKLQVMQNLQSKVDEIAPFISLYEIAKPQGVVALSFALDEFFDVVMKTCQGSQRFEEVQAWLAGATFRQMEAYMVAGFTREEAFSLIIKLENSIHQAIGKANFKTK